MSAESGKARPDVIVDGSNVAWEEQTGDGKPRVANLLAMAEALAEHEMEAVSVVDASLRHQVDDADELEELIDAQRVRQAPADTEADLFVLRLAEEFDALVVSNDTFDERTDEFPWVQQRRVPFMIVHGHVVLKMPG